MDNILAIDLEDWHQLAQRWVAGGALPAPSEHIHRQVDVLLGLLDAHGVEATFFTVGALAEACPEIPRRVAEAGHEIASHTYYHRRVFDLEPETFRKDVQRSKEVLENLTGQAVVGHRAPEFSIRRSSLWALQVLAEEGFVYDSSVFPIRHRRYGIPGFEPTAQRYQLAGGHSLIEVPLSTVAVGGLRLPIAGGGYHRLLPGAILRALTRHLNAQQTPLVTYFHPYEFDTQRLDLFDTYTPRTSEERAMLLRLNVLQNVGRNTMTHKLDALLGAFAFTSFRTYLRHANLPSSEIVLVS